MENIIGRLLRVVLLGVPFAVVGMFIILTAAATEIPGNWLLSAIAGAFVIYLFIAGALATVWVIVYRRPRDARELVAEARSRGECSEEEALELAKRWAELDDREGLGKKEVVTDEEE